jgi:putative spermidine/putrescine transport system permease protein
VFDKNKSTVYLSLAPAIILITIMLGASLFYAIAESLSVIQVIGQNEASLQAYQKVLQVDSEFWVSLRFSLWVSIASTILAAVLSLFIAVWLSSRANQSDTLALNWNLAFPHLVWATALLLIFSQSGLLARWAASLQLISTPAEFPVIVKDTFGLGIILHYVSKEIPFLTLIILAVLWSQPIRYDVVAENLGANRWQKLLYITLPQVLPALLSGSLLVFGFIFSSYEVPAVLGVNYPRALPVLALRFFLDPDLRARSEGMVISLIITAIVLVVAMISLRFSEREK